ncbi:envelope glycoprotein [Anopheles sinensis]|uniref:Envelope glycoprotein n=1 Tax=Anopheles sinensis TaxID=74873 RepID=A0A084W388_ANOSI|nr:envelope glycoprotein [Anopheles sinensis]
MSSTATDLQQCRPELLKTHASIGGKEKPVMLVDFCAITFNYVKRIAKKRGPSRDVGKKATANYGNSSYPMSSYGRRDIRGVYAVPFFQVRAKNRPSQTVPPMRSYRCNHSHITNICPCLVYLAIYGEPRRRGRNR